jgi:hypothetical protein
MPDRCFFGCKSLTAIILHQKIQSFGDSCFEGCENLKSIEIPISIQKIGKSSFENCSSLQNISIQFWAIAKNNFLDSPFK